MARDRWAEWILERRFGGDAEAAKPMLGQLAKVRERVLDRAEIEPGETVLDVGCGDGLIAFGALERVGAEGRVILQGATFRRTCWTPLRDLAEGDRTLLSSSSQVPAISGRSRTTPSTSS